MRKRGAKKNSVAKNRLKLALGKTEPKAGRPDTAKRETPHSPKTSVKSHNKPPDKGPAKPTAASAGLVGARKVIQSLQDTLAGPDRLTASNTEGNEPTPPASEETEEGPSTALPVTTSSSEVGAPKKAKPFKPEQPNDLTTMIRKEERAGIIALSAFILFAVAWSVLAPLSSAAIAPGVISPYGSRKTVQHLEGGIIERILVEDGSDVEAGQPLVLLEDTMARASYELIRTQYFTLAAQQERLIALQTQSDDIAFPSWLLDEARDPKVYEILVTQRQLLHTQKRAHDDRKAVLRQKEAQMREEINGLQAQIDGQNEQLGLIGEEIKGVQTLVNKGLERKPRLLALQRTEAELKAGMGSNQALISRSEQAIGETELELIAADTILQNDIAQELSQIRGELSAAGERMAASADILDRIQITAPVSGKVVELNFHTSGGIIAPGQAILDIVPQNEDLIIEAQVSPMDIDVVHEGLEAQIRLSAFSQRNLPQIVGRVTSVSADRLIDEMTGQPYFKAIIEVDRDTLAQASEDLTLTAGMPAEVMIVTGSQTFVGYLLDPIVSTFRHAFREG